jgi:uncharacterized iron-regulated membrane protein
MRRPRGSLGLPPRPSDARAGRALMAIVLPLAVLFPLVGLSLLAAIAIDRIWTLCRARLAHGT